MYFFLRFSMTLRMMMNVPTSIICLRHADAVGSMRAIHPTADNKQLRTMNDSSDLVQIFLYNCCYHPTFPPVVIV